MEILTEWDELQEAMRKIDLSESTMPYVRGKLCESKAYNEMQKILAAPELIKSHNYILNLDPEQLSEDEIDKVQKIYDLGVNRGFIQPSDDDEVKGVEVDVVAPDADQDDAPQAALPAPSYSSSSPKMQNVPCWTVLYSACNADGDVKTGQCYSNSINIRSAKADCYAKLERCGYTNVKILAIEAGDPDSCGPADDASECPIDKNADKLAASNADDDTIDNIQVTEDDMLKRRPSNGKAQHNGHFTEADRSIDNLDDDADFDDAAEFDDDVNDTADDAGMHTGNEHSDIDGDDEDADQATDDISSEFNELFAEFITAADDFVKLESYSDADDPRLTDAFNDVKAAYEDAAAVADDTQLIELSNEAKEHGLKVSDDSVTIVDIDESEDVLDESGNPYLAGMKTVDAGGVESISGSAKRPAMKKAAPKKTKIDEDDDEDSSSDDSSSDDSSSDDDSSEDMSSSDDTSADEDTSSDDAGDDTDDSDASDDEDTSDDISDNSSDEDSSSDDDDTSSDESSSEDDEDTSDDNDDASDEENADDDSDEDDSSDDDESADDEDTSDEDDSDEEAEDDSEEDDDADDDEEDESDREIIPAEDLTAEQKVELKNDYKKTFKDIMMRCKFEDVCFDDLSIKQKMKFFTKLNKAWHKNEPQDFMSEKEIEQLNKIVIKK